MTVARQSRAACGGLSSSRHAAQPVMSVTATHSRGAGCDCWPSFRRWVRALTWFDRYSPRSKARTLARVVSAMLANASRVRNARCDVMSTLGKVRRRAKDVVLQDLVGEVAKEGDRG